jgi:hypothetical protein
MATSVVCARCATLQESANELPRGWQQAQDGYLCPRCSALAEGDALGDVLEDVLEEEVIYPDEIADDTLDEVYCEVCRGPCQGH